MFKRIKSWFLKIFGDVKVFKWPLWIVYDPVLYQLQAVHIRKMLTLVKPGDILARGYHHYLDGYFIPGKYSHTGIYIGNGMMIHAVAEGVSQIDILDFLQADRCALIRLRDDYPRREEVVKSAIANAKSYLGTKYDYFFTEGDDALYCHEMTASCYRKNCDIQKKIARMSGCLKWIKKKEPVYLASSFIDNPDFKVLYESEA